MNEEVKNLRSDLRQTDLYEEDREPEYSRVTQKIAVVDQIPPSPPAPPVKDNLGKTVKDNGGAELSLWGKISGGTWLNRKLFLGLGFIGVLLIVATLTYAYQQPSRVATEDESNSKYSKAAVLPDDISKMPESYGGATKPSKKELGQPNTSPVTAGKPAMVPPALPNGMAPMPVMPNRAMSQEQTELLNAMKSAIKFGGSSASAQSQQGGAMPQYPNYSPVAAPQAPANASAMTRPTDDPNYQDSKLAFVEKNRTASFYTRSSIEAPASKLEVMSGSLIPCILISGIISDLPGSIVGQVRENVYDSITGNTLLIPQGTKVIGTYDSKVSYGQDRVLVVWTRLIFPNGYSYNIEGMQGVDESGYTGFSDKTNNHEGRLVNGVLLSSVLSGAARSASGTTTNPTYGQYVASGAAEAIAQAGAKIVEKNLNIQPTLEIQPGYKFNIFISKDLVLPAYE